MNSKNENKKGNTPIQCIYCGRFISYYDLENGNTGFYFEPDNYFGYELIQNWHTKCKEKDNKKNGI